MKAEVVELTPELAQEWKARNIRNFRNISPSKVNVYANEMRNGKWKLNGEPIHFYEDGILANGQHRIEAVIKSGVTIKVLAVYGVDNDITLFDRGKTRTTPQIAMARGLKVDTVKSAMVAYVYNCSADNKYDSETILDYYESLIEYFDMAYDYAHRESKNHIMRKAGVIAAVYCAIVLNIMRPDKLEAFCRIVNTGMPVSAYAVEPCIVLRNMLILEEFKKYSGRCATDRYFSATWQALNRFEKNSTSKSRFNVEKE